MMNVLSSRVFSAFAGRQIASQVPRYFCSATATPDSKAPEPPKVHEEIDKIVKASKVVIFMKGTPAKPLCGFSWAVVDILRAHGVEYDAHNVLDRDDIRQGIKSYSSWPTIPQIYINGEFVGGCDILRELHRTGDLHSELEKAGIESIIPKPSKNDDTTKAV